MPAFRSMRKLLGKSSSKSTSVEARSDSPGETSSASYSSPSRDGSVLQNAIPVPGTINGGQTTPNSSVQSSNSTTSLPKLMHPASDSQVPQVPKRPLSMLSNTNRRSLTGFSVASMQTGQRLPNAMYAPRLTNVENGSQVFQRTILLQGVCGNPEQLGNLLDGGLKITYAHRQVLQQECQVIGGMFKFMAYLVPGRNKITLEFFSTKLKDNRGRVSNQINTITLFHIPNPMTPPLRLAIIVAEDSPLSIDGAQGGPAVEDIDLAAANAKFRMAAQMCQAVCGELMSRSGMGNRSFRLEEEWTLGTTIRQHATTAQMSTEPKIQFLPTDRTVAQLQALVQSGGEEAMLQLVLDSLRKHMAHSMNDTQHVLALILDSRWNAIRGVSEGHVNAIGDNGLFRVAVMGSQFLHSVPSCIEDVDSALQDCTRLDGNVSATGMGHAGSMWELADITLTSMFRNILRVFGCDEKVSGINSQGGQREQRLPRLFMSREPFGITSKSAGLRCVTHEHEPSLHKLDALQLRFHPSFAIPADDMRLPSSRSFVWPVKNKDFIVTSSAGITYIEIFAKMDTIACGFLDHASVHTRWLPNVGELSSRLRGEVILNESTLRNAIPKDKSSADLKIVVHSYAAAPTVITSVAELFKKGKSSVKHNKISAFRSIEIGQSTSHSRFEEVIWDNAINLHAVMREIKVYFSDDRIFGIEICLVDSDTQMFGRRNGGDVANDQIVMEGSISLDIALAELPIGFVIWTSDTEPIRGLQVITSKGVASARFGNTASPDPYRAIAPRGYSLAGLSGTVSTGIDSLRLIVKQ